MQQKLRQALVCTVQTSGLRQTAMYMKPPISSNNIPATQHPQDLAFLGSWHVLPV